MSNLTEDYKELLLDTLKNPRKADAYLNAALEEDDPGVFLLALRDVAEARGITNVALNAQLNREHLYKVLSEKGNPRLSSLQQILKVLGLKISIVSRSETIR